MPYTVTNPSDADRNPQGQPGSIRVPVRKRTQEDQDKDDKQAKRQAERDLEKSWLDRLQLISVITTFFASTEAQLLSMTTPDQGDSSSFAEQAANAGLSGALIFHSFAAIMSFTAAFVLIRYRLQEAKREKSDAGVSDTEKQEIWTRDPHVAMERVGFFQRRPPMHLLQRFHTLCISMSVIGFILATVGIMCFAWSRQAPSVGIFSSASLGVCVLAGLVMCVSSSPEIED